MYTDVNALLINNNAKQPTHFPYIKLTLDTVDNPQKHPILAGLLIKLSLSQKNTTHIQSTHYQQDLNLSYIWHKITHIGKA